MGFDWRLWIVAEHWAALRAQRPPSPMQETRLIFHKDTKPWLWLVVAGTFTACIVRRIVVLLRSNRNSGPTFKVGLSLLAKVEFFIRFAVSTKYGQP